MKQTLPDTGNDSAFIEPQRTLLLPSVRPAEKSSDGTSNDAIVRKKIRSIIIESGEQMEDNVFRNLAGMHVVVCGSPRVGKSTLINAICGSKVAEAKEGLASVTQTISRHTMEGQCDTGSGIARYKYTFWDTPGFESWKQNNIRKKVKEIIETPETKPLCMIFCASPTTFVDLEQLEWLLDLCIKEKHIFCALVCTNKYAGQTKNLCAVLDDFKKMLSKYVNGPPREQKDIVFYGNIGLCTSVNSEPYENENGILPVSGVNELTYGIMESLVDDQVIDWLFLVLENKDFWNSIQEKVNGAWHDVKGKMKTVKNFFYRTKNGKVNVKKAT